MIFEQGKCFICGEDLNELEVYAHFECCIAWSDFVRENKKEERKNARSR